MATATLHRTWPYTVSVHYNVYNCTMSLQLKVQEHFSIAMNFSQKLTYCFIGLDFCYAFLFTWETAVMIIRLQNHWKSVISSLLMFPKNFNICRGHNTQHEACTTVPSPFDGVNSPGRHSRPRDGGSQSGFGGKFIFAAAAGCTEQEPRDTSGKWDPSAAGRLSPESCERASPTGKIVDIVFRANNF